MKIRSIVLVFALTSACSEGSKGTDRFVSSDGFTANPFTYSEVRKTLVDDRAYFSTYSFSSGRYAVIDAETYKELWGGYTAKDEKYMFNLPGVEGLGLVDATSLRIVVEGGERLFAKAGNGFSSWNRAKDAIAVFAATDADRKIYGVKYRSGTTFEEVDLDYFAADDSLSETPKVLVGVTGTKRRKFWLGSLEPTL